MKIIQLVGENFKRIKAIEIHPTSNIVELTGENGQGKTSILDMIRAAFGGKDEIQMMPIRDGEEEGFIFVDTGRLKITRKFRRTEEGDDYTTNVIVENDEGARFQKAQQILDALLGEFTFDPLAFTKLKGKEQIEALRRLVPDLDFTDLDRETKDDYEKRRDVNRDEKSLRAQIAGIDIDDDVAEKRIDEDALVHRLEEAHEHNTLIERRRNNRAEHTRKIEAAMAAAKAGRETIISLQEQIKTIETQVQTYEKDIAEMERQAADAPALPDPIDTVALREEIGDARRINAAFDAAQNSKTLRENLIKRADELAAESEALTKAIDERAEKKRKTIAEANLPVKGLDLDSEREIVLLDNVPFDQASDAEQLRASIAIAAAMNPKLRVIRVHEGALLSSKSMKMLEEFADANDLQIWVETVESNRPAALEIVDGYVKGAPIPEKRTGKKAAK